MITKKILRAEDDPSRQKNRGGAAAARDADRAGVILARGMAGSKGGGGGRSGGRRAQAPSASVVARGPRPRHQHLAEWRELGAYLIEGDKVAGTGEREAPGGEGRVGHVAARNFPWRGDESAPVAARDVAEIFDWMADTAAQNQRARKSPALHYSASLPTADARKARAELWDDYLDGALDALGLSEHQALAVEHRDTDNPHIHLVVNRVHPVTLVVADPYFDLSRLEKFNREFERRHGLTVEPGRFIDPATLERRKPGSARPDRRKRGTRIDAEQLARQIKKRIGKSRPFSEARNWSELESKLSENGLKLRPAGRGFALIDDDTGGEVKASKIGGKAANRERLEEHFGEAWSDWCELRDEATQNGLSIEAARQAREKKEEKERAAAAAAKRARALALLDGPVFVSSSPAPYLAPLGVAKNTPEVELRGLLGVLTPAELDKLAAPTRAKMIEARAAQSKTEGLSRAERDERGEADPMDWREVEMGTRQALRLIESERRERGQKPEFASAQPCYSTETTAPTGDVEKSFCDEKNSLINDVASKTPPPLVEPLALDAEDGQAVATASAKVKALADTELLDLAQVTRSAKAEAKGGGSVQAAHRRALTEGLSILAREAKARGLWLFPRTTTKSKNRGWER